MSVKIGLCTLNQLCLDFDGNLKRIVASIRQCLANGCQIRLGPELEVTGYGCEDAFFELDTVHHSWQIVGEVLKLDFKDILIYLSMPVVFESTLYNCLVVIYNSRIVTIRPKTKLAINGNYR